MPDRSLATLSAAEEALVGLEAVHPPIAEGDTQVSAGDQGLILALASAFGQGLLPAAAAGTIAGAGDRISSWAAVERLLRVHRCSTIAYHLLSQPEVRSALSPPDPTMNRLRARYLASFGRTAIDPRILRELLTVFADAGVPALVIKGLTLGVWLYDDPALREYDDFDFVVPEAKAEAVHTLLLDAGFACFINPFLRPRLRRNQTLEAASYQRGDGVTVDLRFNPWRGLWRPEAAADDPFTGLWERRQTVTIAGLAVPTFGPEDQFLHLTRHLQEHDYFRAIWFVDVMLLLRRHGAILDWGLIGHEARRLGVHGGIYRTLEILARVYGYRAPDAAWSVLRPNVAVRHLHRRVWPDDLARQIDRPNLLRNPMGPHHLTLRELGQGRQAAGLALLLLERNRVDTVAHLIRQRFPSRAWLRSVHGGDGMANESYLALWRRHRRQHQTDRLERRR